ncbi:MAG: tyrosine-type recombinase/integrase [Sedimentisphaerales bacterium]|nr:tyrosine-type recombinase/integrase [Sedimentisphaerales bacterium]
MKGAVLDLAAWITDYQTYLESTGYAGATILSRMKHLNCLSSFVNAQGLKSLEEFRPELAVDFTDYWVRHQPYAKPGKAVLKKSRFEPHHHNEIQYSLHAFFRWAHSTGRLQHKVFPLKPPVRGNYFFPEVAAYLRFCQQHKGLARNSLIAIELFVRRFDGFLYSRKVKQWNEMQMRHIDLFIRQQADRNIKRIRRIQNVLRGLFRYLFSLNLVNRDWALALHAPRQYHLAHVPRTIPPDQVIRLLQSIDRNRRGGKRNFAMILMAASLGVRANELANLCLEDLDWKKGAVCFKQSKNRKLLWMPLSGPLIGALASYLQNERPQNRLQRNVFLRLDAPWEPLTPAGVAVAIRKRMREARIAGSGHQLRHSFAGELLRHGVNFSTLQELLGHSHITSTQIYTKIDLNQLREVAESDGENY